MREIKYMAKYLKEAVDCIISTISNNEKIINDLCDDIRFAERARRYEEKRVIFSFISFFLFF
jgi:hypothetical protein